MCAVSVILDYGRTRPPDEWNNQSWRDFGSLIDQAKRFDREHDQPDCDDPAKAAWMREVEERLRKLEKGGGTGDPVEITLPAGTGIVPRGN